MNLKTEFGYCKNGKILHEIQTLIAPQESAKASTLQAYLFQFADLNLSSGNVMCMILLGWLNALFWAAMPLLGWCRWVALF